MTADQLRKSILQQAIQGKLVPQDPKDEPASVLLERIREEKARLIKEKKAKREKNPSRIFRGEDNSYYEEFTATGEVRCIDDEIPFDLPDGWVWTRLASVITLLSGRDLEPHLYNAKQKGIPYLTGASNFSGGNLLVNRWTEVPATISKAGELLLTCKGTIGALAFNDIGDVHIARQIMSISSPLNIRYLRGGIETYVQGLEVKAKSIIPGISREDILSVLLPLPPLAEQERIVAKIEELMPWVEQYGKAQSELDQLNNSIQGQLRKSVLQYAIEGKLVPQQAEDGSAEELLAEIQAEKQRLYAAGKLKKKDLAHSTIFRAEDGKYYEQVGKTITCIDEEIPFDLPESWRWVRIKTLYQTSSGGTPDRGHPEYYAGGIPWVKVGDLTDVEISTTEETISSRGLDSSSAKLFPQGTILIAMYCNDAIGRSCIISKPMTTNQAICGLYPNELLCTRYIYYAVLANKTVLQEQSAGGAQKNINQKIINELLLPLPPLAEQQRIVSKLEEVLGVLNGLSQ